MTRSVCSATSAGAGAGPAQSAPGMHICGLIRVACKEYDGVSSRAVLLQASQHAKAVSFGRSASVGVLLGYQLSTVSTVSPNPDILNA